MSRLSEAKALDLFYNASLAELREKAHAARSQIIAADSATYLVMRIVSVTNICIADCKYCAFYRRPEDKEGYVLSLEQIFEKIDKLLLKGGRLVAMEGGFNPALGLEHYENLFAKIRERYGQQIEIYGPTPVEVLFVARNSKVSASETLKRLWKAGLHWIPGGGAEILTPAWRRKLSPKKYSVEQYLETVEEAQRQGFGTTATMVIGFGETFEDRVEHLKKIRDLQDRTKGFASFLCWTYQTKNTALGGNGASKEDYLKTIAVARLYMDNIPHIRTSLLTEKENGARALQFGADDFDIALEDLVTQQAGVTVEEDIEKVLAWVQNRGIKPVRREPWRV